MQENLRGSDRQISTDREASCCIGNLTFLEKNGKRQLRELPGTEWQNAWVFALAEEFAGDCELHRQTGGTHSCYLGVRDKCVCSMEDIGRHNALDKCIGYALLEQLELSECILFTTGRVPTDMVQKVIAAGIPVLASKAVWRSIMMQESNSENGQGACFIPVEQYGIKHSERSHA